MNLPHHSPIEMESPAKAAEAIERLMLEEGPPPAAG